MNFIKKTNEMLKGAPRWDTVPNYLQERIKNHYSARFKELGEKIKRILKEVEVASYKRTFKDDGDVIVFWRDVMKVHKGVQGKLKELLD